jgi:hypothetical protein
MLRKLLTPALLLVAFNSAQAQDSSKALPFKLSGSADVYYRYNFDNPKLAPYNNLTSFTNSQNSFELGMISLKAEHSFKKVGIVADLGFGRRAEEFSYNDANTRFAVKQLFLTYAPTEKLKFTMGSWATHVGYELVDAYLNRNYSMSYMFSYGPVFHTGLKAEYAVGGKTSLMLGVTNPTDLKSATGMPKNIVAQVASGTKDDKFKAWLNYQGGKFNDSSRLNQVDLVLTYALSPKVSLGYNGTYQTRQGQTTKDKWDDANSWWGSALYVNVDPLSWLGFTLRGEYIDNEKFVLPLDKKMFEGTLSANFKIDNLTIIPELRLDNGSTAPGIFTKNNGTSTKTTSGFLLAAVYHF